MGDVGRRGGSQGQRAWSGCLRGGGVPVGGGARQLMLGETFRCGRPRGALQQAEGLSSSRERFRAPSAPQGPRGDRWEEASQC